MGGEPTGGAGGTEEERAGVMGVERRDRQTSAILGAAVEVHRELGRGFLEAVYQRALCVELGERRIPFVNEAPVAVRYKGRELGYGYRADVICYPDQDPVLVELKALKRLTDVERAQLLHYLRASGIRRGLLLNFGADVLQIQRMVNG